jgi:hypothetical protein
MSSFFRKDLTSLFLNSLPLSDLIELSRNRYVVNTIDSLWEMADVSNIRSHNQNYKYLLFVIDVFSRYLWIQPITEKTSKSVSRYL